MTEAQHLPSQFRRAWTLLAVRLGVLLALTVVTWFVIRAATAIEAFPPNTTWATLILVPVNVLCLVMVRGYYRDRGMTLRQALGVQPGRLGKDVLWGLLWLFVLNFPFALVIAGTVFAFYGSGAPVAFATLFYDEAAVINLHPALMLTIAIVAVVPFMLINAPTEELVFRGYAMQAISARWGAVVGVVVTSLLFGAQHVLFAASPMGMLVFFLAFSVWGACSAVIVRKQGRLLPVVIAHWIINVMMSSPALVFPILQLAGVLPVT